MWRPLYYDGTWVYPNGIDPAPLVTTWKSNVSPLRANHTNCVSNRHLCRVTARPKVRGGFHVGIVGKNFDPIQLQLEEHEKFIDHFHKITGRDDIVFKEITELMYWR